MNINPVDFGYIEVQNWEHAVELFTAGYYIVMGSRDIADPVISFHQESGIVKVEVFDPPEMTMNYFDADMRAFKMTYDGAHDCQQPIYAKKTNMNMRLKQ